MKKRIFLVMALTCLVLGNALAAGLKDDVFKGKLFPPNVILQHQTELGLSEAQFTAIKQAVINVQSGLAPHEWDMREAYQALMLELDKAPIDEARVLELANKALLAENQVKKKQMGMLVRLKNLLTEEQVSYLESLQQ